ncbi:hypothetical protein VINI7043_11591 [Vibrio nigripulchritudo ATCC 27043]|uniref:hypothetical protein n=1 Tax=Vibrio nigripulchritudo TaxID=28173 RepID=UPI00021C2006|nr:hypothetical protein [Vibrio nigripulchritudo]EGU50958.1 hypothetical protein VINI7043_11591 [Vibrio nigripulchritudo ATCC 27043]KJY76484.1 hypothetical protein TW74_15635 [Vibrio nigripulchritudo]
MIHRTPFKTGMLFACALSWVLVTLMPVINAHGSNAGVWAMLCTVNGFELVQIEEGQEVKTHSGKPCPFSHYSTFHHNNLPTTPIFQLLSFAIENQYVYLALNVRYQLHTPRAPPAYFS